jgi:uncharacterized ion transporter superfamily protein YfcC
MKKSLPSPITMLMVVIILAAICTWLIPSGQYNKLSMANEIFTVETPTGSTNIPLTQNSLDSLGVHIKLEKFINGDIRKAVSIPDTYQKLKSNPQGAINIFQAPIKGIMDSVDIILFILIIGGFMYIFNETGAMLKGISYLAYYMKGRESLLIIILFITFALLRATYGMEEEALVFYPILVPLFLAAGYDLLIPLAVIFGGTSIGGIAAITNPFSVIIASNAAGINWLDGIYSRLIFFVLSVCFMLWYILRYAKKIKNNPNASLIFKIDGIVKSPYPINLENEIIKKLDLKTVLLLLLYAATFIGMIIGVVFYNWWMMEMTTLFLFSAIVLAFITRMPEKTFITEFFKGAESLVSVAFIVGVARGVTIILNEGKISDSLLYYATTLTHGMPPSVLILILLLFFFCFTFFITSSSGMAVLTMPIVGALALLVNIPGKEVVNSYIFGMNLMFLITPTGMILPTLAMVNVSYKAWMKFIMPPLLVLTFLCTIFLLVGLYL